MKNFSLRNLTSSLDDIYQDDYQEFIQKNATSTISELQLQEEKEILLEWEIFQSKDQIERIAVATLQHDSLQICVSDFIKRRQTTMEFWVRVAYDLFYVEKYGQTIRNKLIEMFEDGEKEYIADLQNRRWPAKWKDIKAYSCLNLEIIKLYLDYIPIRLYLAKQINKKTNILVDVSRMPYIQEEYSMRVITKQSTYFPTIRLPHHKLLNQLISCRNNYCQNIFNYIEEITPIALQILNILNQSRDNGRTINIYGEQSKFMYQLLSSLKILGASKIFPILRGIKIEREFDFFLRNRAKNIKKDIIITQMTQEDITIDMLTDIKNNYKDGYVAFISKRSNNYKTVKRLIVIFSSIKLKFGEVEHYVQFYKCQDNKINEIVELNQLNFLSFYANMLMNVCELEFRTYSSKTKISSIMYFMWSYVLAKFFYSNFDIIQTEITQNKEIDNQENELDQQDFEICLSDNDNLEIQDLPRKIKKSN